MKRLEILLSFKKLPIVDSIRGILLFGKCQVVAVILYRLWLNTVKNIRVNKIPEIGHGRYRVIQKRPSEVIIRHELDIAVSAN